MQTKRNARAKGLTLRHAAVAATALLPAVALAGTAVQAEAAQRPPAKPAAHRTGPATSRVITTIAGGAGGPAPARQVAIEPATVSYGAGSLYITNGSVVHAVNPDSGYLTNVAGTGSAGPLGDGGPAGKASLGGSGGGGSVTVDGAGNLVIGDTALDRIRVVAKSTGTFYGQPMTAGDIYTVAGNGTAGFSGDGGPATGAELDDPSPVAVDGAGNLVFDDYSNDRIRVVAERTGTFYGQPMTTGDIYTVAGDGTEGFSGDGGPATGAELAGPSKVVVDGAGNLVIADTANHRVRVVAASTGTFYGQPMTTGDIYTVAGDGTAGFSGDGGPATGAELNIPAAAAVDGAGNLVIADNGSNRIRVVAASTGTFYGRPMTAGDIYTVAGGGTHSPGNGGPATAAKLPDPHDVTVDGAGNLVIAEIFGVQVVTASTGMFYGQQMTAGDIYAVAGNGTQQFSGDEGLATRAELWQPRGLLVDAMGNRIIADSTNGRVRVVAASTGTFYGRPMTAGHIYTVAGGGRSFGDAGPATKARVGPVGLALDGSGNLLIADGQSNRVRVVAEHTGTFYGQAMTAGDIYTVAGGGTGSGSGIPATSASLFGVDGVAVDAAGNMVIADTGANLVQVVAEHTATFYGQAMTAGDIYTVAGGGRTLGDGGPATSAKLRFPVSVAVDAAGNLVIADTGNQRVRVVAVRTGTFYGRAMTAQDIYTVAGNGLLGYSGDGGPATGARLLYPSSVVLDGAGNLVIADSGNNRIRVVAASGGTFYGKAMKAGDIYSVAGNGTAGFSGDGGPATKAELFQPEAVTADGNGGLLIADYNNSRVRFVSG